MTLHAAMFSADEIEHALARVEVLKRTLSKTESNEPPFTSLFTESELPPFDSASGQLRPLGKFDTANASYKWGKLEPLSRQRQDPTLFVQQRDEERREAGPSTSPSSPPFNRGVLAARPRLISGPKRQWSEQSDSPRSLTGPARKLRIRSNSPDDSRPYPTVSDDSDRGTPYGRRSHSFSDASRSPSPQNLHSDSELRLTAADNVPEELSQDWLNYTTQEIDPEDGKTKWKCTWTVNGSQCYYRAKKQLMKRHIQGTHQEVKRFKCPYDGCPDRYGQKSALEVHVASRHTGKPHKPCPFEGCNQAFKDPARLHRHKVDVHGYVPKATKRSIRPAKSTKT